MMVMAANSSGIEFGYLAGKYPGVLGHLYGPESYRGPWEFVPHAFDNNRYPCWSTGVAWSEKAWMRMLEWGARQALKPLWAAVPDTVANRQATIDEYHERVGTIRGFGFRPAFVVQNGMTFDDVPDAECMLFLGGTIDWKEAAIDPWCSRFPGRIHVGRVNAWPRLIKCYEAGAVSVDGTRWFQKDTGQRADLIRFCELVTSRRAA